MVVVESVIVADNIADTAVVVADTVDVVVAEDERSNMVVETS